jgi:hypothetical protein
VTVGADGEVRRHGYWVVLAAVGHIAVFVGTGILLHVLRLAAGASDPSVLSGGGVNRGVSISAVTAVTLLAAACSAGSATSTTSTTTTLASLSKVVLLGDGIGAARFGQAEGVAILELDQALGRHGTPIDEKGNCIIDSTLQWSTVTAYFDKDAFVGYSTSFANGYDRTDPNVSTARGLRIGDTISRPINCTGRPSVPRWRRVEAGLPLPQKAGSMAI